MSTKKVKFEVGGDDICSISEDGVLKDQRSGRDEHRFSIQSPDNEVVWVIATYGKDGAWNMGLGLFERDIDSDNEFWPMPDWNVKFGWNGRYSATLEIEVPAGSKIMYDRDDGETFLIA